MSAAANGTAANGGPIEWAQVEARQQRRIEPGGKAREGQKGGQRQGHAEHAAAQAQRQRVALELARDIGIACADQVQDLGGMGLGGEVGLNRERDDDDGGEPEHDDRGHGDDLGQRARRTS